VQTKASFIKRAFPVPRALILSDVSIDISDGVLRYFEVASSKGELRPKAYGSEEVARFHRGVKDEKTVALVADSLKAFSAKTGYQAVKAIVHEGDAYVFKLKVPTVRLDEIRPAIESALEENVPIAPSDALVEYDIVSVDQAKKETVVSVSVLSEKIVSEFVRILEMGNLVPVSIETESRAIARAVISPDDTKTHVILSIKAHHSIVFVVERGKVTFSSSIEVGAADLEKAQSKAEDTTETKLFEAMIPVFATIRDEISKVVVYHKTEAKKQGISGDFEDIILLGSSSKIPGFVRYVSLATKLPTKIGSVWTNIISPAQEIPDLDESKSLDYGSLIGAHL